MTHAHEQDDPLIAELTAYETQVWEALAHGDREADNRMLSDDFLGVYSDGFADKADHVGQLQHGPTIKSYELSNQKVIRLGEGFAMLCYQATFRRMTRPSSETMYVSSLWKRAGSSWLNIFSQDTPSVE